MVFVLVALFWVIQHTLSACLKSPGPEEGRSKSTREKLVERFFRFSRVGREQSTASAWQPTEQLVRLSLPLTLFITAITVTFYYYESEVEVLLEIFSCNTVDSSSSNVLANEAGLVLGSRSVPWGAGD